MSPEVGRALRTLQTTGRVALVGAPTLWSRLLMPLTVVLMGLLTLLIVGVIVGLPIAIAAGLETTPVTFIGAVGVIGMLSGLIVWVTSVRRRHRGYRASETANVVLDADGLTVRGVGPIPWVDVEPAGYSMVPSEYDSGFTRRAVMQLTPSGLHNVNTRLAPEHRRILSPAQGNIWQSPMHRCIYVPGARGLSTRDMMALINAARAMALGVPSPHA